MVGIALGKRFERLLFFTAPISFAAIMVCLVALASNTQAERIEARCLTQAAGVLEKEELALTKRWDEVREQGISNVHYRIALQLVWIKKTSSFNECYRLIDQKLESDLSKQAPADLIASMRKRASELHKAPLSLYGVSLPRDTTLDLYVAKITVDLLTLTRILQIVLFPVLLLWLGSLYSTRYRESITTASAISICDVFPHIINIFPSFDQPSPRKRSYLAPHAKGIACFIYAWVRVALLLIFILPPTLAYGVSLFLGATENFSFFYVFAGVVLFLFFFSNILAEFFVTHYHKVFPDPARNVTSSIHKP